jgi:hypothetical protein
MDEETLPLFENPPQPETPEALLQKRKHELLLSALLAKEPKDRRRLAEQYADLLVAQHLSSNPER